MKLIGKQIVVELPKKYDTWFPGNGNSNDREWLKEGFNRALSEVARMNPAWEVDATGIENVIENWLSCGESRLTPDDVKEIAQSLATNLSAWLKRKDSDENK